MQFPRVRTAYDQKESVVRTKLKECKLIPDKLEILLIAFKKEKLIELWGRDNKKMELQKIKSYSICDVSGKLGPKRMEGDDQTPEGFYSINRFNPSSNFYLSLGIDYPNKSDRILSSAARLGGDIFIHGNCVTIGCMPITDDKIKELYIYAIEAKNNGETNIPVYIFPSKLDEDDFAKLKSQYSKQAALISFWTNLKQGYDKFEKTHQKLNVSVNPAGKYLFE